MSRVLASNGTKKVEADYPVITHIPQIVQGDEYQVILASMSAQLLSN